MVFGMGDDELLQNLIDGHLASLDVDARLAPFRRSELPQGLGRRLNFGPQQTH